MTFTDTFRRYLIHRLLEDDRLCRVFLNRLEPEYFNENAFQQKIVAEIRSQYQVLKHRPSPDFLVQKLSSQPKEVAEACYEELEAIFTTKLQVTDKELDVLVREFILYYSLLDAMNDGIDYIGRGEYDKVKDVVVKAFDLQELSAQKGLNPFDLRAVEEKREEQGERTPTVWPTINRVTYGGIALRELWFILSRRGGFKSYTLVNILRGALIARVPTVVYTLEMAEFPYACRLISLMTGVPFEILQTEIPPVVEKRMGRLMQMLNTKICIKQFPTKQATVGMLKADLMEWELENDTKAKMVIVDSADLLRSERGYKEHRHSLAEIWMDLRGWAVDSSLGLWTAKHTNRYSDYQEDTDNDAASEDITCANIADFAMSINQTKEEYKENFLRFQITKWRNNKGGLEIPIQLNERTLMMKELTQ
jgi:replicative DNA helicase